MFQAETQSPALEGARPGTLVKKASVKLYQLYQDSWPFIGVYLRRFVHLPCNQQKRLLNTFKLIYYMGD